MQYVRALKRAVKRAFTEDEVGDSAAAITYYAFLSIPSLLLVAVGFFSLFADAETIADLMGRLAGVVPDDAISLLEDSLTRVTENQGGGLAMIVVGFLIAAWTVSGTMGAVIRALNRIFGELEGRGFVKQRAIGVTLVVLVIAAFALVFGLLVLGPYLSDWTGLGWVWWLAQWPILVGGLLLAFGLIYWLGPNRSEVRFKPISAGSLLAVVIWLAGSGAFAVYVSMLGSYNKAWGSLAAVIVMLTWLWLSSLALLLGAELDADLEGCRDERRLPPD
ncbi:MAG: YihY/virulence factor BrkB family protein [Gaiellaceae bacterium]